MLTYSFILFSVVLLFNMIIAMLSKTFSDRSMHVHVVCIPSSGMCHDYVHGGARAETHLRHILLYD